MFTQKTTIEKLNTAAKKYAKIREEIRTAISTLNPVEVVTPINVGDEKKAWLEKAKNGVFTNPHFEYNQQLLDETIALRPRLIELLDRLMSIPATDDVAEQFVLKQLEFALRDGIGTTYLAEAISEGNDNDSADAVVKKYGLPTEVNVEDALEIAKNNDAKNKFEHKVAQEHPYPKNNLEVMTDKSHELEAKEIKDMFLWTMKDYPANSWPVIIDDTATSIDVRDKSSYGQPVIVIPTKRKVTGMKLAELIGHEIESHWRSSVNAEKIGALKCDDELVYEGLAVYKDKLFNRRYLETFELNNAYYVVSISEATKGKSFEEVSKIIFDLLPESLGDSRYTKAWMYTYRVFRGITNAENPEGYAFTKDRAYFEGWRYAKSLEEQGKYDYLSFSTLNQTSFERLMEIIDIEDVKAHAVLDLNLQEKSLEKILKCITYGRN